MASNTRSFVLLTIALLSITQVLAYDPKCQSTVAYILDCDGNFDSWGKNLVLGLLESTSNFSYINYADLAAGFKYSPEDYSFFGPQQFSVATLNTIHQDISTRYISGANIILFVSLDISTQLTGIDAAGAMVAAANRLKEVDNVEIFLVDLNGVSSSLPFSQYKVAQDIASNTVEKHVYLFGDPLINIINFVYSTTGMSSIGCTSIGSYFYTPDGAMYQFNGLGEYVLFTGNSYEAQVRMAPCDYSNPSSRTCLKGVAIKSQSGDVIELHYDPVAQFITVYYNGGIMSPRSINPDSVIYNSTDFVVDISTMDTPIDSDVLFTVTIEQDPSSMLGFTFFFGQKMGLSMVAGLNPFEDFGRLQGLCGVWDGCVDNDYYSQNQTYSSPSGPAADVYYNFAESWKVTEASSLFTHGVNAKYYMPHYSSYSPQWHPALTGVNPTANAPGDCALFKDVSSLLYTACVDEVSKGNGDIRAIASIYAAMACSIYCESGASYFTFVNGAYCASTCPTPNDLDFHDTYNATELPPVTLESTTVGSTFSATLGGTYTYELVSEFCPDASVTGTVQITCDYPPQVNAGDDRVVQKHAFYGWPQVILFGTASDQNSPALEHSWKLISSPYGPNVTAPGSWGVDLPNPVPIVMDGMNSATPQVTIQYPGDYVFEYSVFDGCFIAKDRVIVHAQCASCDLHVEATGIADQTYQWAGTESSYQPTTSTAQANIFDYTNQRDVEYHWFIDSNTKGYQFQYPTPSSNDVYDFTITPPEVKVNETTVGEVDISNSVTSSTGTINTATILRYEGIGHFSRSVTTNTTTVTTTKMYSSIPVPVTKCTLQIQQAGTIQPVLSVLFDADANVSRPFNQQPACVGDYALRVGARDECKAAQDVVNFHLGCSEQPQAHLVTCTKTVQFIYQPYPDSYFPSVSMDGRDTFDPDTDSSNLLYQWQAVAPTGQTDYFGSGCVSAGDNVYQECPTPAFTPFAGAGTYNVTMWVSDGCTYDSESTTVLAVCDPLSVSASASNVIQGPFIVGNMANLTGLPVTQHLPSVGYSWRLVSAPAGFEDLPYGPFLDDAFSANTTATIYLAGTYTFELTADDRCTQAAQNVSFTYTCSDTLSFSLSADHSAVAYDVSSHAYNSSVITVDLSTVNVAGSRAFYRVDLTASPEGSIYVPAFNGQWISFTGPTNPTVLVNPDVAGTYTFKVWASDSCNLATHTISITASCTSAVPAINGLQASYLIPSFGTADILGLFINDVFLQYNVYWDLINSANVSEPIDYGYGQVATSFGVSAPGTYQVQVMVDNGGCSAVSVAVFTATCNATLGVSAPAGPTPSNFTRGKFSRVTLTPQFTGVDPSFVPMSNFFANYTWTFIQAPVGSVFAPTTSSHTTMSSNTTITPYVWDESTRTWNTTQVDTYESTTVVDTKFVTLGGIPDTFDTFDGCFSPDVAGDYLLEFSINGYCGQPVTQRYTVTAACNGIPTVSAGSAATYTFDGTGFADYFGYMYTAIALNATASDPDGDFLRYQWSVLSQPTNYTDTITINNPNSKLATFVPTRAGVYVVQLSVTDGCNTVNSSVAITVVCPNTYKVNDPISFTFDGFTPVALQEFSLMANPQCTRAWNFAVTSYDPSTAIPPVTATGEQPKSGASQIAIPAFLIAFLTLFVRMF